jgi:hypothetical protein
VPTTDASSQQPSLAPASASVWLGSANKLVGSSRASASSLSLGTPGPRFTRRRLTSEGVTSSFSLATQRAINSSTVHAGSTWWLAVYLARAVGFTHSVQLVVVACESTQTAVSAHSDARSQSAQLSLAHLLLRRVGHAQLSASTDKSALGDVARARRCSRGLPNGLCPAERGDVSD